MKSHQQREEQKLPMKVTHTPQANETHALYVRFLLFQGFSVQLQGCTSYVQVCCPHNFYWQFVSAANFEY
jgi:hypothetical protein